jgi:hypothetical protein
MYCDITIKYMTNLNKSLTNLNVKNLNESLTNSGII